MRFRLLLLSLALIVSGPLPARADTAAAKDIATIGDCLRQQDKKRGSQEADEAACLMTVAKPCMGDETSASTRRQIECLERERSVWDKIVNDSYQTMIDALEPDQQAKLREMQRSWIQTRDLTCAFLVRLFRGHDGQSDDRLLQQSRDRPAGDLAADFCRGYRGAKVASVARMSAATCGHRHRQPAYRCAHAGYALSTCRKCPIVGLEGFLLKSL
jgi:uncharacterized protein YecT (DUF1311 family)